jgi:hypothetical protein
MLVPGSRLMRDTDRSTRDIPAPVVLIKRQQTAGTIYTRLRTWSLPLPVAPWDTASAPTCTAERAQVYLKRRHEAVVESLDTLHGKRDNLRHSEGPIVSRVHE